MGITELFLLLFFLLALVICISELIKCLKYYLKGYGAVLLSGIASYAGPGKALQLVKPGYASFLERSYLFFMVLINLFGSVAFTIAVVKLFQ